MQIDLGVSQYVPNQGKECKLPYIMVMVKLVTSIGTV